MTERQRVNRLRWAVRAVLWLGIAVSIAANVLHAHANPISQAIAAWPPVALFLTVELISRVPGTTRQRTALRVGATGVIALIAAWVSYWHMQGVCERYGETADKAYLIPLTVDGLIVAASVCLVEIGARLATLDMTDAERERERLAAADAAAAKAARSALKIVPQAPRSGSTVVRSAVVDLAQNAEAPARPETTPAEAAHDEVAEARQRKLAERLRAECLAQGRIMPRDEARQFLGCKTNNAGKAIQDVRASLGMDSRMTEIPAHIIERESV